MTLAIVAPHPPPILESCYSSTHDTYYQAPEARNLFVMPPAIGGFMSNRPMFSSGKGSLANAQSASHGTLVQPPAMRLQDYAGAPIVKKNTAHMRAVSGAVPIPSSEFTSTNKSAFVAPLSPVGGPSRPSPLYGGSEATQYRPHLLHIESPPEPPKAPPPAFGAGFKARNIRDGLHTGRGTNDWTRSSTVIGATHPPPATAPVGAPRQAILSLLSRNQGLFAEYRGHVPGAQKGQWNTECHDKFVNPKTHPEPVGSKQPPLSHKMIMTWHPTDKSAKLAVETMRQLDGTLVAERPSKVHPSVWRVEKVREAHQSMGPDPYSHKSNRRSRTMPLSETAARLADTATTTSR